MSQYQNEPTYTEIIGQQTVQIHLLTQQLQAVAQENEALRGQVEELQKPAEEKKPAKKK